MIRRVVPLFVMLALLLAACSTPTAAPEATLVQVTPLATDTAEVPPLQDAPLPPIATVPPTAVASLEQDPAPLAETMDEFMVTTTENGRFSGAVLVASGDEILLSKGYGLADREQEIPNTPTTRFRIGLLTRAFTAMAILQLQELGKLDIHDPVCNYITNCPEDWNPITIHHLLTHSSGISDQSSLLADDTTGAVPLSPEEVISQARDLELQFEPGTTWNNSNVDYLLLGQIIELVSGQTYEVFLQEHIFDPLGMSDTGFVDESDDLAKAYVDPFRSPTLVDGAAPFAFTGLYSTVEDMYRWVQALQTTRLISEDGIAVMFTPYVGRTVDPGKDGSFGYGWTNHVVNEHPVWGCCERYLQGYAYDVLMFREDGVTSIVLSNQEVSRVGLVADTLTKWALESK